LQQDRFTDLARKPFESGACQTFIRRVDARGGSMHVRS